MKTQQSNPSHPVHLRTPGASIRLVLPRMILLLLIFWLLQSPRSAMAQSVFPDSTDHQVWEYVTWYFWGGMCALQQIRTGPVTSKCGREYIPLLDCNEKGEMCRLLGYYRLQGDSVLVRTNHGYLNGVMDTVVCEEPEGLMYDFGAQPGDTLICQMNNTFPPTFAQFWAVAEEVQTIEGTDRRVLTMHYRPHPNAPEYIRVMRWISGIGSTVHPVYSFACIGDHCEQELKTVRATLNDEVIFVDTTLLFPCNGWVSSLGQPDPNLMDWQVFPNPASGSFTVSGPFFEEGTAADLSLCDALGRTVGEWPAVLPGRFLELGDVPPGVYVLQLRTGFLQDNRYLLVR